jgi:hypothetical protein
MRPYATSVCGLKLLVYAALSYYLLEAAQLAWVRTALYLRYYTYWKRCT